MSIYKHGMETLCRLGVTIPINKQVLLKAILKNEDSEIMKNAPTNTDDAISYEVVAVAEDCVELTQGDVGMHCLQISTAATPSDFDLWQKKRARYIFVNEADLICIIDPKHAEEAISAAQL